MVLQCLAEESSTFIVEGGVVIHSVIVSGCEFNGEGGNRWFRSISLQYNGIR